MSSQVLNMSQTQRYINGSSFIAYLIVTLIQSTQNSRQNDEKILESNLIVAEVCVLFYIIFVNIILMINVKRLVR